jgi:hypothetical protein
MKSSHDRDVTGKSEARAEFFSNNIRALNLLPPATMLPDVFECAFKLDGTRLTVPPAPAIGVMFNRDRHGSIAPT